jgi:PelA/Pel-15E family pectate lyase
MRSLFRLLVVLVLTGTLAPSALAAGGAKSYLKKPIDWFRSEEGRRITASILSYQSPQGSWPKNLDTTAEPYRGDPKDLKGTYDNSATTDELRFLARAYEATQEPRCQQAFLKGLDHILQAQYPNGGWPQSYPPGKGYPRHITFNDGTMVRLMEFLREVATGETYDFVAMEKRKAAQATFDRGVQCILKCQIRVDGKLTAWCAQHDENDFSPRSARSYELVSLSGSESVGITRLLMSLERPSPEVVRAIEGAVAWFEAARLTGIKVVEKEDKNAPKGFDRIVVRDPDAPPLWARFYEIGTNKPIFSDRNGVPKRSLAEIGYERRNGYAWLGNWPAALLTWEYPAWKEKRVRSAGPRQGEGG